MPRFSYEPASPHDLEELVALRIEAMRESLERLGRFEPGRARERFVASFEPDRTRFIVVERVRVGFVVVKRSGGDLRLDHLYLKGSAQGRGIGGAVLQDVLNAADRECLPLHVDALRGSDANRFYVRHGFLEIGASEWDIHYRRDPGSPRGVWGSMTID
jgi:GNAT superfamily N-acetyltransferase